MWKRGKGKGGVPEERAADGDECCLLDVLWWMEP
jgi:hypothetical protein